MKTAPLPPAAPPLAGLLADMRTESALLAVQAGVVAVLRTMILDCLIRLFGRLDHLLVLWQSGQLALPSPLLADAPRRDRAPEIRLQQGPSRPPAVMPPASTLGRAQLPAHPHRALSQHPASAAQSPSRAIHRGAPNAHYPPRIRPPPWRCFQNCPYTASPSPALIVPIS